jgi:uncharacterized protein (TIGR02147 family)
MSATHDYREWLKRLFGERKAQNPAYSLRAFARDLSISSSQLSLIFKGKKGLSRTTGRRFAERLFPQGAEEREYFQLLVDASDNRSRAIRGEALVRLAELPQPKAFNTLPDDVFRAVSDWYHFAIIEMVALADFDPSPAVVARRLGISEEQAGEAWRRLLRLNLVSVNAKGKFVAANNTTPAGSSTEAVREHLRQIQKKSIDAIETVDFAERDHSVMMLRIDPKLVPELRGVITAFRRRFSSVVDSKRNGRKSDEIYCLGMQLFPLSRSEDRRASEKELL